MKRLTIAGVEKVIRGERFVLDVEALDAVQKSYDFLKEFSRGKIIYGINTGFGPMAQWRIADKDLEALQYNIIRSHSTGAGEALGREQVRAAMMARIGTSCKAVPGFIPRWWNCWWPF